MINGVILWHPWPVFADFFTICAHLGLSEPFVSEMAQMDCQVPKSPSKCSQCSQGCQMITGVILWHPWPVFAEFLSVCAHLCLSVPFVSEMAQMDCQVPKSLSKCSQGCQRITGFILWHPWPIFAEFCPMLARRKWKCTEMFFTTLYIVVVYQKVWYNSWQSKFWKKVWCIPVQRGNLRKTLLEPCRQRIMCKKVLYNPVDGGNDMTSSMDVTQPFLHSTT